MCRPIRRSSRCVVHREEMNTMTNIKIEDLRAGNESGAATTKSKKQQPKASKDRLQVSAPLKAGKDCSYEATGDKACNKK
jgi:hypothetical protein